MGKGDKKSRRGKIFRHSFGKRRPQKKTVHTAAIVKPEKVKKAETASVVTEPEKETTEKTVAAEKKSKKGKSTKKGSKE